MKHRVYFTGGQPNTIITQADTNFTKLIWFSSLRGYIQFLLNGNVIPELSRTSNNEVFLLS